MKNTIAIVTGTRAEYGLLKPLIKALHKDNKLNMQLIVTGMHLSEKYGYTIKEIEADGFPITAKIDSHLEGDSAVAISIQ